MALRVCALHGRLPPRCESECESTSPSPHSISSTDLFFIPVTLRKFLRSFSSFSVCNFWFWTPKSHSRVCTSLLTRRRPRRSRASPPSTRSRPPSSGNIASGTTPRAYGVSGAGAGAGLGADGADQRERERESERAQRIQDVRVAVGWVGDDFEGGDGEDEGAGMGGDADGCRWEWEWADGGRLGN
jgi:hypothetical protein